MNKLLLCIFFLIQITTCFSQRFNCPIKNGYLHEYKTHPYFPSDQETGIRIISSSQNTVESVFSGFVLDVLKHDEFYSVIVQKGDTIIAYRDLIEPSIKKGDFASAETKIGTIAKNDLGYALYVTIWIKRVRIDARDYFLCLR